MEAPSLIIKLGNFLLASGFILGQWDFKKGTAIDEAEFEYWNLYNNENKFYQTPDESWSHLWWQNSEIPFPAPSNGINDLVLFRKNTTQEKLFILNEAQY